MNTIANRIVDWSFALIAFALAVLLVRAAVWAWTGT